VAVDLFAGIAVSDYVAAVGWYERLLGVSPAFLPNDIEAVWEVADHSYLYIEVRPRHCGHARHTLFVDDLDSIIGGIADRGLAPVDRVTLDNGVRKATYQDPDGSEISFGGAPTQVRQSGPG